jgi:ABC-type transporter Mla subunit MlaD
MSKIFLKHFFITIMIFIVGFGTYFILTRNYVVVRFDELGPLTKNMSAYYKGFKIGRITKIYPDKDFKHTLVKVVLTHEINLPQNTLAAVERFPNGELYLQFVYPKSPSLSKIKRGDVLEGMAPYDLEQFMMGQSVSGMSDLVSIHIIKALNGADAANRQMQEFFHVTSQMIKNNGKGIGDSVNNLALMTEALAAMSENLNQASKKLNQSIAVSTLKGTTTNVKDASQNIKDATKNIKDATSTIKTATDGIKTTTDNIAKATKDIDKTMQKVDETVSNANATTGNLNIMTRGINNTLSKKFGGMRIIFGTPMSPNKPDEKKCAK